MNVNDLATDEEEFHSSFRIWLHAAEMLASSPAEQCRLMGNHNVAWELKEDVRSGKFLVGRGYLTPIERSLGPGACRGAGTDRHTGSPERRRDGSQSRSHVARLMGTSALPGGGSLAPARYFR